MITQETLQQGNQPPPRGCFQVKGQQKANKKCTKEKLILRQEGLTRNTFLQKLLLTYTRVKSAVFICIIFSVIFEARNKRKFSLCNWEAAVRNVKQRTWQHDKNLISNLVQFGQINKDKYSPVRRLSSWFALFESQSLVIWRLLFSLTNAGQ